MNDINGSQSHNPFAAILEGQLAYAEALWGHVGEAEAKAVAQAKTGLEEQTRLAREAMSYAGTLSAEWRKASFELARRSVKMFSTQIG